MDIINIELVAVVLVKIDHVMNVDHVKNPQPLQ